jgi:hypothetical protein
MLVANQVVKPCAKQKYISNYIHILPIFLLILNRISWYNHFMELIFRYLELSHLQFEDYYPVMGVLQLRIEIPKSMGNNFVFGAFHPVTGK